jgi:hypothetical protein
MGDDEYHVICLLGREIPNWFSHKGIGSSISFRAPSISKGQFLRLLVSAVYAFGEETNCKVYADPHLLILNKASGNLNSLWPLRLLRLFRDSEFLCPKKEDNFFLCQTPLIRNQYKLEKVVIFNELFMESGDEIVVTVNLWNKANVKKCGVHLNATLKKFGVIF